MQFRSIVVLLVAFGLTPALAQAPAEDAFVHTLRDAIRAHVSGNDSEAAELLDVALDLLDQDDALVTSNAGDLLRLLHAHRFHVAGVDPIQAGRLEGLERVLQELDYLNTRARDVRSIRGADVSRDPFTGLARSIGDLDVRYDPFTKNVTRVGDVDVRYDPFRHVAVDIAGVSFRYDSEGRLVEIQGVRIR